MDTSSDQKKKIAAIRRAKAHALREQGLTYKEIGAELGVGLDRARQLVAQHQRRLFAEERWRQLKVEDDLRNITWSRQELRALKMLTELWPKED